MWTRIGEPFRDRSGKYIFWKVRCRCACGKESDVFLRGASDELQSRSCNGCAHRTHGHGGHDGSRTSAYSSWAHMMQRCTNERHKYYPYYGGRGIRVCARWLTFEHFLDDMGDCPIGHTLERDQVNGDYELGNCRWATRKEQMRNRRVSRLITFAGRTATLSGWAELLGVAVSTLRYRLATWPMDRALRGIDSVQEDVEG